MEEQLRAHPHVEQAALLTLEQSGEARVGAVVVASPSGIALDRDAGRRALTAELADHLAQRWDRVLLPRAWRIVAALPEDAQGKVTARLLRRLFEDDPEAGAARPEAPTRLELTRGETDIECLCEVPIDLAQLEGHFPGLPVVPGVAQVGWALQLAGELRGAPVQVSALEALKFPAHLLPGARLRVRVEAMSDDLLIFRLWHDQEEFASGRIRARGANPEAGG
jgi:3-hydroxymyristoyl/3-hydroxydecanoyl-(acyl carrier protein) dehydratase